MPRWNQPLDRAADRIVDMTADCWEWDTVTGNGYGYIHADGRRQKAARYVWEQTVGPIPDGLVLDHLCTNPPCVNPDHLEPVTQSVNSIRGGAGHHMKGQTHCRQGHVLAGSNVKVRADGHRTCRECSRVRKRAFRRGMSVAEYRREPFLAVA